MGIAAGVLVIDGAAGTMVAVTSLLAIPPVIAATGSSVPETAVVGVICLVLAVISGLTNESFGSIDHVTRIATVVAGVLAGLWVASLRENLQREQAAADLFVELGERMENALDQHERAAHLAELAVPSLSDVAMVDQLDDTGAIVRIGAFSGKAGVAEAFTELRKANPIDPSGAHPVAVAIRTGEIQEMGRLSDERIDEIAPTEAEREALRRNRFHSCLVLPLRARGSTLGALTLWILQRGHRFDEISRRTAIRLSQRAALALDNARLHEQQAHIAAVLQHSLRPRSLPEIPGFALASRFEAAGEAYEVGGDFYDAFRTGSRSWTIVVGDVCGKGPEAAALTSLARYTVRTAASPRRSPSAVLRALHSSISEESTDLRYCTAALLRLDPPSNGNRQAKLTVALGGHPPPMILRRNGRVQMLGTPGTLLGAIPNPEVEDTGARLAAGDSLVLYTDGVLDSGDRRNADDPDWLAEQLAGLAGRSATEVADALAKAAIERQGGEPRDDIAIVVLGREGRR